MLALGNLSRLGPSPYGKDASTPQELDKVRCRAYIRDCRRKEKTEKAEIYPDKETFFADSEIAYLYDNGHWYHACCGLVTDITSPLVTHLKEEYGPYPNLKDAEAYILKGGDYPLERMARKCQHLAGTRCTGGAGTENLYVFRRKDNPADQDRKAAYR
ncbi:MAG: hypothetical protein ACLR8Y_16340 [Alistipes indistinctus]